MIIYGMMSMKEEKMGNKCGEFLAFYPSNASAEVWKERRKRTVRKVSVMEGEGWCP
jgi:hypothetical protein